MSGPRALLVLAAISFVAAALVGAACGSEEGNPPPVEPTASPPPAERPAGEVIEVGNEPEGVAVDPETGLAAVALRDPNRLELIDVATGRIRETVRLPESARHLELGSPGGPVLVPAEYTDQLVLVELPGGGDPTGREPSVIETGDFPHDAVRVGERIFVGDEGADTISVISDGTVEMTLPAPEQPGGVAETGGVVAAVAVAERVVAFYDAETLEPLGEVEAGAGPSHVVAGDDGRFYVADTGGDAILVYEADPEPRLVDRTNLPGSPYGIAIDPGRERLWVTQTGRNTLAELELTELAPRLVGSYPTVRQPNTLGVDERTGAIVVAGRTDGEVQIIRPRDEPR